jgi:hypothetical protein
MRWTGHVARVGKKMSTYMGLAEKPEIKRTIGIPRRIWEDNVKKAGVHVTQNGDGYELLD